MLGAAVGLPVSWMVGRAVGVSVGSAVGGRVGSAVGGRVGEVVGVTDGSGVEGGSDFSASQMALHSAHCIRIDYTYANYTYASVATRRLSRGPPVLCELLVYGGEHAG